MPLTLGGQTILWLMQKAGPEDVNHQNFQNVTISQSLSFPPPVKLEAIPFTGV